ncbi:MAG: hypothetical protein UX91_C0006G0044 [Candidatus Amesbacteria bacterium GW2011_GWB1_47_19]|nr:MAG: hypothetical protein UW51_C0002G0044 [Candidatus Amesbacteria bacterium GW2011_GWA1_44_24]KKU31365.1 MAG: hypothetical protein UX46_C0006G0157 [Candidatus Amesbacteria bacterium GW2011_GWC1_46_24]KKU66982.1 MAG: hypothetical protein UX91_C0006G0044 [Candidatus Amesbacteria bacterium GW2011_GWB1_47_19]OGD05685.1 MAG: hypothetical protein A2379_05565 [Candidatus Amesbacteria bacterium RIFOXYB1_FULL_47_13]HBC72800.1 hypothetical protein [Candidatus Amesbacteria bacterium]
MKKLIDRIIEHRLPVYFISPHLDDAVFSAGGLISRLSRKTQVKIINVFTRADNLRPTLSAAVYLRQCGSPDARRLFIIRKREDAGILKTLGIKPIDLDYTDALWRRKKRFPGSFIPELGAVYPTYRWHVVTGKSSPADSGLIDKLSHRLSRAVPSEAVVFAPLSIGRHVDHVIIRNICSQLPNRVIYWCDFPYNQKFRPDMKFIGQHHLHKSVLPVSPTVRHRLISGYRSQTPAVFPAGIPPLSREIYYYAV